jgi:lipid-A-disaccharide synthase
LVPEARPSCLNTGGGRPFSLLANMQPRSGSTKVMIVAGEASGDKHGAALARALTRLNPDDRIQMFGSGGQEMREAGVETLVDARSVAIIGVPEIARALGRLYRAYRTLLAAARARRPDVVVLIDWPDFNLRLAKRLHREGFKIIYYISPQVWAWRKYRVRAIRRSVDRMLVILPFEEEFYRREGVQVEYVGHPLTGVARVTASREEFTRRHGLDPSRPIIALLPGSRAKEIHYHLPAMIDGARRVRDRLPDPALAERVRADAAGTGPAAAKLPPGQSATGGAQFVLPLASTIDRRRIEGLIQAAGADLTIGITIVEGDTYNALGHADIAVVASGTATVEAALVDTPMVIVYRGSLVNWLLIRPLIHLDTFGMVNLIAGERVVPELIQYKVTGERIAGEILKILSDQARLRHMKAGLEQVREQLYAGEVSASERAAASVMQVAGCAR